MRQFLTIFFAACVALALYWAAGDKHSVITDNGENTSQTAEADMTAQKQEEPTKSGDKITADDDYAMTKAEQKSYRQSMDALRNDDSFTANNCHVSDGDLLRCDDLRIRLNGIDAPELHSCPSWRTCVEGDGTASKAHLETLTHGTLTITPLGRDKYDRLIAMVDNGVQDFSCAQLIAGQAQYKAGWDDKNALRQICPYFN